MSRELSGNALFKEHSLVLQANSSFVQRVPDILSRAKYVFEFVYRLTKSAGMSQSQFEIDLTYAIRTFNLLCVVSVVLGYLAKIASSY